MYCVIVGDIINSKKIELEDVDNINQSVKDTLNYINTVYRTSILADFGLVRGDAFEGILLSDYQIPKIINEIIKGFYRFSQIKVRICVVLGELTAVSTDRNEANGPAFYKATDSIDKLKAEKSEHWFQVSVLTESYAQPLMDGTLSLISSLTEGWTDRQREIIWAIEDLSGQQRLVSRKFNISASGVNKQLKAAHYAAYRTAWSGLEEFFALLEDFDLSAEKSFLAYYGAALRKNSRQDYKEACNMLLKSKEIAERELDPDNPQLILIYNGLAENYIKAKDYETAETYINQSFKAQQDLPKSRLAYAATLNISGDLYLNKNLFQKAADTYEAALDVAMNTVGSNHYFTFECNTNTAKALHCGKDYRSALDYYLKALEFSRAHSQRNPISLADTLFYTARCYLDLEDEQNAKRYADEALLIYKDNLPPRHGCIIAVNEFTGRILP